MTARVYYYTGTGNSLWVARLVAADLGASEPQPMLGSDPEPADAVGLVFPVHMWGPPAPVVRFAARIRPATAPYLFAFAVNAGDPAGTLPRLARLFRRRGARLAAGVSVVMPSNYTPYGGPGSVEKLGRLFSEARETIAKACRAVRERRTLPLETRMSLRGIKHAVLYRLTYGIVPSMDRLFRADEKCSGCGVCAKVCPAGNVSIDKGRPTWHHRCEQCYACLQWCPEQAIQSGSATASHARYHHPEVTLQDMLRTARRQS